MDAAQWSEAEGFEAHGRFLTKAQNPHRRRANPASASRILPEARAQLADAWDRGWDRAEALRGEIRSFGPRVGDDTDAAGGRQAEPVPAAARSGAAEGMRQFGGVDSAAMVSRWPKKLAPAVSFTQDGYRFAAYANMERSGHPWAGYVTVRSIDHAARILHRWMVKGEHLTLEDFIAAARTTVREQLATSAT